MKIGITPSIKETYKNQLKYCVDIRLINFLNYCFINPKIFIINESSLNIKNIDFLIISGGNDIYDLVKSKGYSIVNIDATVILESPKVNPHIAQMQEVLAAILEIQTDEISIKATTHEKVDSFGEKRAIKAYAAALLYKV